MSGTSADSIDTLLVDLDSDTPKIIAHRETPLDANLQQQIINLSTGDNDSLHDALILDRQLAVAFANAVEGLLEESGTPKELVNAIGSHGQTLRHQPSGSTSNNEYFTLQVGDPNTIAELTGIDVVADFRRRDIAAGGQAAPLAPGFHAYFFSDPEIARAVVNIGGFTNVSLLIPDADTLGFDTGPGNCLLDGWIGRQLGLTYDKGGQWAAEGEVNCDLLEQFKAHEYFQRPAPKSTGRELFNMAWVDKVLGDQNVPAADLQSTLMQLTVDTLLDGLNLSGRLVEEIYVCGGGAQNTELMKRLKIASGVPVETTAVLGVDPKLVEACAFAWMAKRTLEGEPANLPSVTGASGLRVLGGIYQA